MMSRTMLVIGVFLIGQVGGLVGQANQPTIEVYKSATCGCCGKWIEHLQAHGFKVRATNREDLADLKATHSVPPKVQSCHTGVVNGYVIEGHVPASDIQRLLKERPVLAGLAVPGMPIGSPGMEIAGSELQPFDVVAFDKSGKTRVFSHHGR